MAAPEESPLALRLAELEGALRAAESHTGRPPHSVRLLAVTKTVEPARIREAWELGLRTFGENYVQEAARKAGSLPPDIDWHFIGRLQSNKAKQAVELFSVVQSLDRPSLGEALERAAAARGGQLDVLLQVNLGGEESKAGATAEQALGLARRSSEWPSLRVRGLMAIPPYSADPEEVRPYFRALRELRDRLAALLPGLALSELSMGMSGDFRVAVEEGATIVRIGTALFGERS
jgi:PLP dependent protein